MLYTLKKEFKHVDKIKSTLRTGLRDYNRTFFGDYDLTPFALYFEDNVQKIIAGVSGFFVKKHHALRIEYFWVDENHRQQGLGRALMNALETFTLENACSTIQVSTMAFQGVEFYEKMGFQRLGTIPEWFCGVDEHYYLKKLTKK